MESASFEAYRGAELREVSTARTVDVVEYVLRRPSVAECLKDELGGVNSIYCFTDAGAEPYARVCGALTSDILGKEFKFFLQFDQRWGIVLI